MTKIKSSPLADAPSRQINYGYMTIVEDESGFIFQQSQSNLFAIRICFVLFFVGNACLFAWLVHEMLPIWLCLIFVLSVTIYIVRVAFQIYPQPIVYFTVEKQPEQINVMLQNETTAIVLKREETYAFYVWLTCETEHEEGVLHIGKDDKNTTLSKNHGYGDNAKQIALFLGNLWDKPVMLRDEKGHITELLDGKKRA